MKTVLCIWYAGFTLFLAFNTWLTVSTGCEETAASLGVAALLHLAAAIWLFRESRRERRVGD
ncbi:MAG: hypothetical protein DRJ03_05235 [Chloroflexi bacterium]|nr:MAG: hypothetical protein DRJ03_05235 [Chloroflexota bacterium]